jgi:4-amino-4-deoxy-L-arabinose transferase-like glycosyltransferase
METRIARFCVLGIVPALLYFAFLWVMPLTEPDEGRYAEIPSLMNRTGDYVTPRLQFVAYFEKPPLVYWATALSYRLLGEGRFSARLFIALCAWAWIILAYRVGRGLQDERLGLYAAALFSTFLLVFILGQTVVLDLPVSLFLSLAVWSGYRFLEAGGRLRLYALYLFSALAFLAKGLIGVVFPFAILAIWLLVERRWRAVFSLFSPVGFAVLLAVALPWVYLAHSRHPDFLYFFLIYEHFGRYTGEDHGRVYGKLSYLPVLLWGTIPWSAFFLRAVRERGGRSEPLFPRPVRSFLLVWILFVFIFFSLSTSKLVTYILPLFLPLAVYAAEVFRRFDREPAVSPSPLGKRILHNGPIVLQSVLLTAAFLFPLWARGRQLGGDLIIMISDRWIFYPLLAIVVLAGLVFLPEFARKRWGWSRFFTTYGLAAALLGGISFPAADFLAPYRSSELLVEALRRYWAEGEMLYQYRMCYYGIDFYLHRRSAVVNDFGELKFGIAELPREEREKYFLELPDFNCLLDSGETLLVSVAGKDRFAELKRKAREVNLVWDNGFFYLARVRGKRGTVRHRPERRAGDLILSTRPRG